MTTKSLLMFTAWIEVGAGGGLLVVPSLCAEILLGEGLLSPPALVVARVAAAALMSLGVACWLGRSCERRGQAALVAGMLIYNVAVPIVLILARFAAAVEGIGLWPACILHTALAVWCVACLRPGPHRA